MDPRGTLQFLAYKQHRAYRKVTLGQCCLPRETKESLLLGKREFSIIVGIITGYLPVRFIRGEIEKVDIECPDFSRIRQDIFHGSNLRNISQLVRKKSNFLLNCWINLNLITTRENNRPNYCLSATACRLTHWQHIETVGFEKHFTTNKIIYSLQTGKDINRLVPVLDYRLHTQEPQTVQLLTIQVRMQSLVVEATLLTVDDLLPIPSNIYKNLPHHQAWLNRRLRELNVVRPRLHDFHFFSDFQWLSRA